MRAGDELYERAASQHGCVTAVQLAAAGVDRRAIARGLAARSMRRMHRGVYLLGPVAPPLARQAAALLAVGADAALSHRAAAALYELVLPGDGPIDVTAPERRTRRRERIRVHTTTALPSNEVRRVHRLRVTSPERTLIDLAAAADDGLARAVEEAQVRRLVSPATLRAALERHGGRRGTAALAALLGAHTPSLTRSEAERRLLALIRAAALPHPRTNARVGRHEVDFLWPEQRVIVEVDGFAFHSTRAAFERDRARDAELQARGYRVIRVTWHQLATQPHVVVARLAAALALAAA